ncbi:MAG: peptide-methionine (S)-S-oxide reductase MsrA [Planctomycetales bacterium]|nr:peptide-methionine (S)-S-oxide reductase MsrA [Planctomycetales bacterium]
MSASSIRTVAFVTLPLILLGGYLMAAPSADETAQTAAGSATTASADQPTAPADAKLEKATFGAGCFWCIEAVFEQLKGVKSVESGYSGGRSANPTYEAICTGATGHAEVIQITYDPAVITYPELLEVFWKVHDPTTLNRQGPDTGTQYRSVVFYHDDQQRQLAEKYKAKLDAAGAYPDPIVTEIAKFEAFYPAEDYHQDYFAKNPGNAYCRINTQPKLDKLKQAFADKLKGAADAKPTDAPSAEAKTKAASAAGAGAKVDWKNVDWKKRLTPEQYRVTRTAGTEAPFRNEFFNNHADGTYTCVCCGVELFSSEGKYDSGCGWPSFYQALDDKRIRQIEDRSHGMVRTEIRCANCDAHLGHIFDDGPEPTGVRYCMNSASMKFKDAKTGEEIEGGQK